MPHRAVVHPSWRALMVAASQPSILAANAPPSRAGSACSVLFWRRIRAVTTARVAAGTPGGQVRRGQDEEPGAGIGVTRLTRIYGPLVGDENGTAKQMVKG